ncbi:phytoene desaturase family protein [Sphingobium boeckii]|uniref:Pyridine nucleotide-disulfide oxidoreductase domain-containing protein 2 n=1 Tax=Sphingobium boeckii TaxID=1082345 RepID=A0A7W9AFP5_9SPHN|nr:NAD(P)/FAD-dependent oxidoreductase [Sphingobium boeckii]MBB5684820.1 phytoene dehydrogenase-like protein [Sphingobium boeckii]
MAGISDVIVVGAGHNSLTTAAYLAAAGLKVTVFEKNEYPGGGVVSLEKTLPGFKHDLHSTGHIFIQANPLIEKDELGLQAKFGLEYLSAGCYFTSLFPDGTVLQTFSDLDKSCESIAQFSQKDADSYRAFVKKSELLLPMFQMALFNPPMGFGTFAAMLEGTPDGKSMLGDILGSAWDMVHRLFEHDKVRMHYMRWASEGMIGPETNGTGSILYMQGSFCHRYNCKFPKGGSGELSHSLVRCIEHHGGEVVLNAPVKKLLMDGGRATGVELADGSVHRAKRAVVASVHPKLLDAFTDGALDDQTRYGIAGIKFSDYAAVNTHYALNEAPNYKGAEYANDSFAVEAQPATMKEFRQIFDDLRYGEIPAHISVLSICNTNHDPARAPEGKHTLYLYTFMPYALADGGPEKWHEIKEQVADQMLDQLRKITTNMGDDNILGRYVESPRDMEICSPSFQRGDICGVGLFASQFMGRRPTPELGNYTVPGIKDLYLVGPFMHPGGGVIGGGRPVAIKIFQDLGMKVDHLATL